MKDSTTRPWRAPELRDLGSMAELTQAAAEPGPTFDSVSYAS
jgi:hypothetical protein